MKRIIIFLIIVFLITGIYADEQELPALKRIGLFIGSNNGGLRRLTLLYAITDATSMYSVMEEVGGIDTVNSRLLANPDKEEVTESLDNMKVFIADAKQDARRVEFMFYYSGHSDEEGLLINGEHFLFSDLRTVIDAIDADVSIVILDSCASGAFTRIKGGLRLPPFLIDDSSKMEGHAFLTSSSENEAAQESDRIGASFFTYYLVSGLRGAADTNQDQQVTLNEVYQYAFSETLSRTENTQAGPQHPSYNIQLTGTGDLILTDLRSTSAVMLFDEDISGRIYIRDSSGNLVAEVNKLPNIVIAIALPPGEYFITLDYNNALLKTEVFISSGERVSIEQNDFSIFPLEITTSRGTEEEVIPEISTESISGGQIIILSDSQSIRENIDSVKQTIRERISGIESIDEKAEGIVETIVVPILEQLIPAIKSEIESEIESEIDKRFNNDQVQYKPFGFSFTKSTSYKSNIGYNFQLGIVQSYAAALRGCQMTLLMNEVENDVRGAQFAFIMNTVHGDVYGHQGSLILNRIDGNLRGSQTGLIYNKTGGDIRGAQLAGIFNLSEGDIRGAQLSSIFNISDGNIKGAQISSVYNSSQFMTGVQIGIVNKASIVNGTQIGLINIADEIEGGVPIGLINIIGNGQFHGCTWYDGNNIFTFGLKTGTKYFYSLLSLGFTTNKEEMSFYPGIGLGVEIPINRMFIDLDLSLKGFIELEKENDTFEYDKNGLYASLRLLGGVKIFERLSLFAGLLLDMYAVDESSRSDLHDGYFWSFAIRDQEFEFYPQWTVGLQF